MAAAGATRGRRRGRGGDAAGGSDRWRAYGRVSGGDAVAEEAASDGGRPYGVSSVHACDDGSRIAVSGRLAKGPRAALSAHVYKRWWRAEVATRGAVLVWERG